MGTKFDEDEAPTARPRKLYQGGHTYNINSLSFSSDGEIFMSADDLRINMWNTEINNQAFCMPLWNKR
jgi:serine/threonine-protein phosphatase 2A regulatory subunit B